MRAMTPSRTMRLSSAMKTEIVPEAPAASSTAVVLTYAGRPRQVGTFPPPVVLGTPCDACHHTRQRTPAGRCWRHEHKRADPLRSRHLALLDPDRGDSGCPTAGLRLGDHALRPTSP